MKDEAQALAAIALFGIGAVAVVLYQHASSTAKILGVAGGVSANLGTSTAAFALGAPASLAGTPTIGQDGSSRPATVVPLNIDPGYTMH